MARPIWERGSWSIQPQFSGQPSVQGMSNIADFLESRGCGRRTVSYRLRDWLISRQRYWGTPIPIIYCNTCGAVPVPEDRLPVLLPPEAEFKPTGESPLALHEGFVNITCLRCGESARRETDTIDTFLDSSWYMERFSSPKYDRGPFDPQILATWMPVRQYTGGAEHAVMHLMYARFFTKALRDMGLVDFNEPFLRLFNQGVILGEDHEKMSKSRGNVVNPDEYVESLGADSVRCFLMFLGPWDQGGPWSSSGINGVARWLNRVWELCLHDSSELDDSLTGEKAVRDTLRHLHQTMRKCYTDLDRFKFNTAIAALMEFSNELIRVWNERIVDSATWSGCVEKVLVMLAPFAPHLAEELWERNGYSYSVHHQLFPKWDEAMAAEEQITLVVQVNGRLRDKLQVLPDISEDEAKRLALDSPRVKVHTDNKEVQRTVYVPGRLVNFVVR